MSPSSLRRYRAERLLREEFDRLREQVLAVVGTKLRAAGARLDRSDLEACYSQAWHGLYTAMLEGRQIENRTGWLVVVTFRRAIEEHRARERVPAAAARGEELGAAHGSHRRVGMAAAGAVQPWDPASALDDRATLRQLFEALRSRLNERERQAAALCYLQSLSRSEAAAVMGVSERRMRKLMEGRGAGRPGVAAKMGALIDTISAGGWCEEQASLMRGFAFGILDPRGERYRLALMHQSECPACRAYVLSLRGLAAALPPVPTLLRLTLGAVGAPGATAAGGAHLSGLGTAAPAGTAAASRTLAPAGAALGGAASASGAAGAGVAGGGWLFAGGGAAAKLAVGCVLALGIGAGCVALTIHASGARSVARRAHASAKRAAPAAAPDARPGPGGLNAGPGPALASPAGRTPAPALSAAAEASREFGPEQAGGAQGGSVAGDAGATARSSSAVAASARVTEADQPPASAGRPDGPANGGPANAGPANGGPGYSQAEPVGALAAEREFAPG